jgi:hypothetical protein
MLSSAPEASTHSQHFSVLSLIILPCPLRASLQGSFVCEQSDRLMERNCAAQKLRTNVTSDKRIAAKVMLTFSAPFPDKVRGVPSRHD